MDNTTEIEDLKDLEEIAETRQVDTLLECLLFLSKYHERPASAEPWEIAGVIPVIWNHVASAKTTSQSRIL